MLRKSYERGVERVMSFCTDLEYTEFMRQASEFERNLVRSGVHYDRRSLGRYQVRLQKARSTQRHALHPAETPLRRQRSPKNRCPRPAGRRSRQRRLRTGRTE